MSELRLLKEQGAKANRFVIEKLEELLKRARSGELVALVLLYDGAHRGFSELGDWDPERAVYAAECWKAKTVANKAEYVGG